MPARPAPRHTVRSLLRDELLDAAVELTVRKGWTQVRMAEIAAAVGISRQTVYNELGSKPALAQALVEREAARFLAGVRDQLDRHGDDVAAGLSAAATFALRRAEETPLVAAALAPSGVTDLLPLLTTGSRPIVDAGTGMILDYLAEKHADLGVGAAERRTAVDSLVRLVISHIVMPQSSPSTVGAQLSWLIERVVGTAVTTGDAHRPEASAGVGAG